MNLLPTARFCDTVVNQRQLDRLNPERLPEIAFVGRSNAGKSSCINLICGRRRLAFASRTPGRTQALNVFALGKADTVDGFLVDTPGYGFAQASQTAKLAWQSLAGDYIRNRTELTGLALMIDVRRELTDLDRQLLQWTPSRVPVVVVLTKSDKLGRQQLTLVHRRIDADPALTGRDGGHLVLLFSTIARRGIESLQAAVETLVRTRALPASVGAAEAPEAPGSGAAAAIDGDIAQSPATHRPTTTNHD